jgi:hypothetical protein
MNIIDKFLIWLKGKVWGKYLTAEDVLKKPCCPTRGCPGDMRFYSNDIKKVFWKCMICGGRTATEWNGDKK